MPPGQTSKKSSSTTSSKNTEYCCKPCNQPVEEDQASVECETCLGWFHTDCVDLNKSDLKTIKKPGIHWYCPDCNNSFSQINQRLESIERQVVSLSQTQTSKQSYSEIVKRLNDSIKQNESLSEIVSKQGKELQDKVSKQISTIQTEIQAESRAKNVIIFGIKEEGSIDNTIEQVETIFKDCGLHYPINKSQTHRLGAKAIGENKSRPIRIALKSETEKWEVLRRVNAQ
jgi:vacuolar-type H+-ATPase subunit I/STV1